MLVRAAQLTEFAFAVFQDNERTRKRNKRTPCKTPALAAKTFLGDDARKNSKKVSNFYFGIPLLICLVDFTTL